MASDERLIDMYFNLLEQALIDNGLLECPGSLLNCDEQGLPLNHTPSAVVAIKGQKHPRAVTCDTKKQITVLACASAAGNVLPPL